VWSVEPAGLALGRQQQAEDAVRGSAVPFDEHVAAVLAQDAPFGFKRLQRPDVCCRSSAQRAPLKSEPRRTAAIVGGETRTLAQRQPRNCHILDTLRTNATMRKGRAN